MTEVAKELEDLLQEVYLAGWHDTAPDYSNPDILKAQTAISKLLEKQDIKSRIGELESLIGHSNEIPESVIKHRLNSLSQSNEVEG